jgi:DMSO/TMAO reductase YedYZ molybdopterin-dependent catalytic subunit
MNKKYLGFPALVVAILVVASLSIMVGDRSSKNITNNDDFFNVSISPSPTIDSETWELRIDGLVENPASMTYDELKSLQSVTEIAELDCVAGPSSVAYWSGVRLSTVLDIAKETSSDVEVVFYSVDGFSTDISVSDARRNDVILAYEMNNVTLPIDHGYPIRLVVPNEFGYKWAKWT